MLPTTASGRFRFMFVLGLCVLAIAVLALWIEAAFELHSLGGFAL